MPRYPAGRCLYCNASAFSATTTTKSKKDGYAGGGPYACRGIFGWHRREEAPDTPKHHKTHSTHSTSCNGPPGRRFFRGRGRKGTPQAFIGPALSRGSAGGAASHLIAKRRALRAHMRPYMQYSIQLSHCYWAFSLISGGLES